MLLSLICCFSPKQKSFYLYSVAAAPSKRGRAKKELCMYSLIKSKATCVYLVTRRLLFSHLKSKNWSSTPYAYQVALFTRIASINDWTKLQVDCFFWRIKLIHCQILVLCRLPRTLDEGQKTLGKGFFEYFLALSRDVVYHVPEIWPSAWCILQCAKNLALAKYFFAECQ